MKVGMTQRKDGIQNKSKKTKKSVNNINHKSPKLIDESKTFWFFCQKNVNIASETVNVSKINAEDTEGSIKFLE
jgi:hypothetical protein